MQNTSPEMLCLTIHNLLLLRYLENLRLEVQDHRRHNVCSIAIYRSQFIQIVECYITTWDRDENCGPDFSFIATLLRYQFWNHDQETPVNVALDEIKSLIWQRTPFLAPIWLPGTETTGYGIEVAISPISTTKAQIRPSVVSFYPCNELVQNAS